MNKTSDRQYFGLRININSLITEEQILKFISRYQHYLICKEDGDKEVKNTHTHIIIWGDDQPVWDTEEKINATEFKDLLHKEIKGTRANGRWALEHKGKEFYKACKYLCKGHIGQKPNMIGNTDFNDLEIEAFWREWWTENLAVTQRLKADDSLRNIEVILKKYNPEYLQLTEELKDARFPLQGTKSYSEISAFWFFKIGDHYYDDIKTWDDRDIEKLLNGLMLQCSKQSFLKKKFVILKKFMPQEDYDEQYREVFGDN